VRIKAIVVALALAVAAAASAGELAGKVVRVHDGDTLTVLVDSHQIRVRLTDIDAPELGQAFGRRSRDSLAEMCAGVVARVVEQGHDRYGRTLGRVTCASFDTNTEQVRRGMAWVFVRYAAKNSPLYQLQAEARLARRGLWLEPQPIAPWDWRQHQRDKARGL
jgi:endonuclease YncB( thermonuclease family)